MKQGALNAGIRAFSLLARFALAAYLAKYYALEDVGLYGIMYSITAAAPAILGFGFNFSLNREIATIDKANAYKKVRDRLVVSSLLSLSALPLVVWAIGYSAEKSAFILIVFSAILVAEVLSLDLHVSLICLKKAVLANTLLFARTALWVYPLIALGFYNPSSRTLDFLLTFWLCGNITSLILVSAISSKKRIFGNAKGPIEWGWFREKLRSNHKIYLSDLSNVGIISADRFILANIVGLEAVGVYVFFWTIANSVQLLVNASITQISLPFKIEAFSKFGYTSLLPIVQDKSRQALLLGTALSLASFVFISLITPHFGKTEFTENNSVFIFLLIGAVIRGCSDIWNNGLYSAKLDNKWVTANITGAALTVIVGTIACWQFGMLGLAASTAFVSFCVLALRFRMLKSAALSSTLSAFKNSSRAE